MIITSLAKLVTAIAFEAIDYWFESSKMFVLYILYIQEKERSINWLVWRSPKSSVGVRVTSLLIFFCQLQTLRCIKRKIRKRKIYRALSLIGRVPNCQLGLSQFESGRARYKSKSNLKGVEKE